jgi:hypothetical protein
VSVNVLGEAHGNEEHRVRLDHGVGQRGSPERHGQAEIQANYTSIETEVSVKNSVAAHVVPLTSVEPQVQSKLLADNQIFGYQVLPGDESSTGIMFAGASPVQEPSSPAWGVRLFASPHTSLQSFVSTEQGLCSYVWGIPAHPDVRPSDIPAWCASVVAADQYTRFQELLGTFVVIVDEPRKRRLTFVSDILGIRPLFIGCRNGGFVFGSDVWSMHKAGLTTGKVDYDAVGSWIAYGYCCTGGSFFADLRRLPPGTAVVVQDGQTTEKPYTQFAPDLHTPTTEQAAEYLHDTVSSSLKALVANHSRLSLSLSGGFDSRYLLALAVQANAPVETIVNVRFTREESEIAHQVADRLQVPVLDFPVEGNLWDIYDDVYHFTADGFPISKFVTYCIAQQHLQVPMLNGFLGGVTIRGFDDTLEGKYEDEFSENLAGVLQRNFLLTNLRVFRLNLFRGDFAKRMLARSLAPLEELVQRGSPTAKVFDWALMFNRQRYYASNNFLQHLGFAEALLPFYNWRLISYKMAHPYRLFNDAVYTTIFRRYFPQLADITHSDYLRRERLQREAHGLTYNFREWWNAHRRVAHCTRRQARRILPVMGQKGWLDLLRKDVCLPATILACTSFPQGISRHLVAVVEKLMLNFERLYLLEKQAKEAGVDFTWEGI